jgi:hypothetical protein
MRIVALVLLLVLTGCAGLIESYGTLNQVAAEAMYGDAAIAGTLAPYPQSSGCTDARCRELDNVESQLYAAARSGRIPWVQLVDDFYRKRTALFPTLSDTAFLRELRAYQRALAEGMDQRKITESQWVYAIERKVNELRERYR